MHSRSALLTLVLASCASLPTAEVAPPASLRAASLELDVRPSTTGLEIPNSPANAETPLQDVRVHVSTIAVEPRAAAALFGGASRFKAYACEHAEVERWLADLEARGATNGQRYALALGPAPRGSLAAVAQTAYIGGFTLEQHGDSGIADPRIEVVNDGLIVEARAERDADGAATSVALEITLYELDRPVRERSILLATPDHPVSVQQPTGILWHLRVRERLAEGEVLVLAGDTGPEGNGLVALVRVEPASLAPDTALQAR